MLLADTRAVLHRGLRLIEAAVAESGTLPRHLRWSLDVDPYDTF